MEFEAGNDRFSLFVNPGLGAEPMAADAMNLALDTGLVGGIGLFGSTGFRVDEIRIGHTWADVTTATVPEPHTLALVGLALAGLLRRARPPVINRA